MNTYITTDLRKKTGIYKILNTHTQEFYIGSSITLYYRLKQHYKKLITQCHVNFKLQNSWNVYGEKNFKIEILEYCNEDEVRNKEIEYINSLKPEFNLINDFNNYYFSQETREKMSKSAKNLNKIGKNHPNSKEVECYDLDGNYVKSYESVSQAIRQFVSKDYNGGGQISKCIWGNRISAYGFQWKLKEDNKQILPLNNRAKLNAIDGKKKIVLTDNKGNDLEFTNSKNLTEYLNQQLINLKENENIDFNLNISRR